MCPLCQPTLGIKGNFIRANTDQSRLPWPDPIVPTWMSYLKLEVSVRNVELISYHQLEEFGKSQKERGDSSSCTLPTSQNPGWNPSWLMRITPGRTLRQNDWPETTQKLTPSPKTRDRKAHGRAVLLSSLILLLFTRAPLPSKISYFVSPCVSMDNSFQSVRQELTLGPGRGPPSCNNFNERIYSPPIIGWEAP